MILYNFFITLPLLGVGLYYGAIVTIVSGKQLSWAYYIFLTPFVLIIVPFIFSQRLKKIPFYIFPILVFILLQLIPLPRSTFYTTGGSLNASPRWEPQAIGMGYPFAIVKYFLGDGCLESKGYDYTQARSFIDPGTPINIKCKDPSSGNHYTRITPTQLLFDEQYDTIHSGDVVLLSDGILYSYGLLVDTYIIFFIIGKIKRKF